MGWFSGDDDYDKDGNPQRTRKCSGSLLESLGTADLDYLFKAQGWFYFTDLEG